MLKVGDKAPTGITVENQDGVKISLKDFRGNRVVVYFYPKDDTPGCTKEACGIRDVWVKFKKSGIKVLGVSPDKPASHQKFIAKYGLPFDLLADVDHKLAEAFGAWGEKKLYGRTYMGIIRSTFVVDENGKVSHVFPKVKPAEHAEEILSVL